MLGLCFHCQVLGATSMVSVDVCLGKKEGIFGREAGAWCLGVGAWQRVGEQRKMSCAGIGKKNMSIQIAHS